ncbi:MAG: cobalamin-dependent protein [Thermodesulfobacteriota bacterium]|nr:cobalamin-dependent protein [Thermodesulfobacteriota bacterium]
MTSSSSILGDLEAAVRSQAPEQVAAIFQDMDVAALGYDALLQALVAGLDAARRELGEMTTSIGEFLLAVDAARLGLTRLKQLFPDKKKQRKAVVGVATGEVHSLGVIIIAGIMEALGYEVMCLEQDTNADQFLQALKQSGASLLGVSSMMSTTLAGMQDIVQQCRREMPDVRIIVGGACLDEHIAESMGADEYVESAVQLPRALENFDGQDDRRRKSMDYEKKEHVVEYHESGSREG